MTKTTQKTGRFMLEMLGVLAVIGGLIYSPSVFAFGGGGSSRVVTRAEKGVDDFGVHINPESPSPDIGIVDCGEEQKVSEFGVCVCQDETKVAVGTLCFEDVCKGWQKLSCVNSCVVDEKGQAVYTYKTADFVVKNGTCACANGNYKFPYAENQCATETPNLTCTSFYDCGKNQFCVLGDTSAAQANSAKPESSGCRYWHFDDREHPEKLEKTITYNGKVFVVRSGTNNNTIHSGWWGWYDYCQSRGWRMATGADLGLQLNKFSGQVLYQEGAGWSWVVSNGVVSDWAGLKTAFGDGAMYWLDETYQTNPNQVYVIKNNGAAIQAVDRGLTYLTPVCYVGEVE